MYAVLKEGFKGVNFSEWSCKTRVENLIDFIENYYDTRKFLNRAIEKHQKRYTTGNFNFNEAFDSFYLVVSYASNCLSGCFDYPRNWSKKYNTYTQRKATQTLLNKYMYKIAVKR